MEGSKRNICMYIGKYDSCLKDDISTKKLWAKNVCFFSERERENARYADKTINISIDR